jgi:hypothetical protein
VSSNVVGIIHPTGYAVAFYRCRERPMSKANETLRTRLNSDPCASIPEEAKRTLDDVRRRYGIHVLDTQARPPRVNSVKMPMERSDQGRPPSRPESSTFKKALSSTTEVHSNSPSGCTPTRAAESSSENRRFYYLIRIAECALALLCEVTTHSDVAARQHVNQIPNLLECREISSEEFLSLSRDFN